MAIPKLLDHMRSSTEVISVNPNPQKFYLPYLATDAAGYPPTINNIITAQSDNIIISIVNAVITSDEDENRVPLYDANSILYSTDGLNWSIVDYDINGYIWNDLTYGDGKFIAYRTTDRRVIYSSDGLNWNSYTLPSEVPTGVLKFCIDKFIMLSDYSGAYSTDGLTWTNLTFPSMPDDYSLVFESEQYRFIDITSNSDIEDPWYVIVGQNCALYSTNGIDWSFSNIQPHVIDPTYGRPYPTLSVKVAHITNRVFIAISQFYNGVVLTVNGGQDWAQVSTDYMFNMAGNTYFDYNSDIVYDGKNTLLISCLSHESHCGVKPIMVASYRDDYLGVSNNSPIIWNQSNPIGIGYGTEEENSFEMMYQRHSLIYFKDKFIAIPWIYFDTKTHSLYGELSTPIWYSTNGINWLCKDLFIDPNGENITNKVVEYISPKVMRGADFNYAGISGLVPAPDRGQNNSYLRGDGIWVEPEGQPIEGSMNPIQSGAVYDAIQDTIKYIHEEANLPEEYSLRNWSDLTYGNGKYVAVGEGTDAIIYSADGFTWKKAGNVPSDFESYESKIAYGNDKFVIVSRSGQIIYSFDGNRWYHSTIPEGSDPSAICYGDNKFVSFNAARQLPFYSTDGITWSNISEVAGSTSLTSFTSIAYGYNKFIFVSPNMAAAYYCPSTDLSDFNYLDSLPSGEWSSITCRNNHFVVVSYAYTSKIAYSRYGTDWTVTDITPYGEYYWNDVVYGDGKYVAVSSMGSWEDKNNDDMSDPDERFCPVAYSYNGTDWTIIKNIPEIVENGQATSLAYIAYDDNKFVAIPGTGTIAYYSYDGINWTHNTQEVLKENTDITDDFKNFVAPVMIGTEEERDGAPGLVPLPTAEDYGKVLSSSGEWINPPGTFQAVYDRTTFEQVNNAYQSGKFVYMLDDDNRIVPLAQVNTNSFYFRPTYFGLVAEQSYELDNTNTWRVDGTEDYVTMAGNWHLWGSLDLNNQYTTNLSSAVRYFRPILTSTQEPTASDGNVGDIWIVYEE